MKRSTKLVLAILFYVVSIIFIILSIVGFFPDSWKGCTDIFVIIILYKLLIEALLSVNR